MSAKELLDDLRPSYLPGRLHRVHEIGAGKPRMKDVLGFVLQSALFEDAWTVDGGFLPHQRRSGDRVLHRLHLGRDSRVKL